MPYPIIDQTELSQIAEVARMSIGDFSEKPIRYAYALLTERYVGAPMGSPKGRWEPVVKIRRGWFRYFFDGLPDHADDLERRFSGSYFTAIHDCTFGAPPKKIYRDGKVWTLIRKFLMNPEVECPGRGEDNEGIVSESNAKDGFCYLCDERQGEKHGMIYLGEGWYELVYRAR